MDGSPSGFRLERGSTGFFGEEPMPSVDPRTCRTACYAAARAARGWVGSFAVSEYARSYHSATIHDRDGGHCALFHAHHPLVAFVDEIRYVYTDQFLEPPAWAAALCDFGFTVLSASVLLSPLSTVDTSALTAAEWQQIDYWRADTVGPVLFNTWD